jgi:RNA polymerase sigma-70 factor (TIGR02960 family)
VDSEPGAVRGVGRWENVMVTEDLLARARSGDGEAFGQLVEPYRRELQVYCYRMLASVQDAEDVLQETMLAAWQGLGGFAARASLRTWLYRIATSRCLNALRAASRRPAMNTASEWGEAPADARVSEVTWLEPFPDVLLEGVAADALGADVRFEATEAISLAFVTALQVLPPRQRAALVLRDVLGFSAIEAAGMLDVSPDSVVGALRRARATLAQRSVEQGGREQAVLPDSPVERRLVERLTRAYAAGDVEAVVALLTEDVRLSMPPTPFEYRGVGVAANGIAALFGGGRRYRLVETRANGQPAFGVYVSDRHVDVLHASGLMVLTLRGVRICAMTLFGNGVLGGFGLPRTLPAVSETERTDE